MLRRALERLPTLLGRLEPERALPAGDMTNQRAFERPRQPQPSDFRWLLPLVLSLMAMGASAFTGYARTDKDFAQRLTMVEAHVADDRQTLQEIKAAVNETNDKLNELLQRVGPKR